MKSIIYLTLLINMLPSFLLAEVPVISNPLSPPSVRTVEMEEVWRIGANDDEDFLFGVIGNVLSDKAGNFYLLDTQLNEVFKFSAEGQYLQSISRSGEGPGEISVCYFCNFWDDVTMGCVNISPNWIVRFDTEGIPKDYLKPTPLPDLGSEETISISSYIRRDGFIVARGQHYIFDKGELSRIAFLSAFDDQMDEVFRFMKQPTGYNFLKPITIDEDADYIPYSAWTLGDGGEVYMVPDRTHFLIEVRNTRGELLRKINRDFPLLKRSAKEKEEAKNRWIFSSEDGRIPDITYKISDYSISIKSLKIIDNKLWVSTSRNYKEAQQSGNKVFDIFDMKGHLLEKRIYQIPCDPKKDSVHWLDGGRAVVVKNIQSARMAALDNRLKVQIGDGGQKFEDDEESILEVILYKIKN